MINLIRGDCLEKLADIPNGSIDCCITDLPYETLNRANPHAQWDNAIDMEKLWPELYRVCKETAPIILFGQGLFSARLVMSNPKGYRYTLIWDKVNRPSDFLNANRKPLRIHEDILVFYRKQPIYNPQMTYGDVCHKRGKAGNSVGGVETGATASSRRPKQLSPMRNTLSLSSPLRRNISRANSITLRKSP